MAASIPSVVTSATLPPAEVYAKLIDVAGTNTPKMNVRGAAGPDWEENVLPAVRGFVEAHPEWIAVRHDPAAGEIDLSCDPADRDRLPSYWVQALNLTKAGYRFIRSGLALVDDDTWHDRLNHCALCPHRVVDVCGKCGCVLSAKAQAAAESCPDDPPRWYKTA